MNKSNFMREVCVCIECNHKYRDPSFEDWKCPKCGGELSVHTDSDEHVFIRKRAEDVIELDTVYFKKSDSSYTVLDNRFKKDKYHIALKSYGVIQLKGDEWLNCIIGLGDGDFEELYKEAESI